jgi:cobalt/nickel transport system permease protein
MDPVLERYAEIDSPLHRLDARAKIISLFALVVVCVTTPPRAYPAFGAYLALLAVGVWLSRVPPGYVLRRSLMVVPFVLLLGAFMPFLRSDGLLMFWNVLAKSYLAVLALTLLSATTSFPKLLQGFRRLRVPAVLTLLAALAYRYLFVIADEALRTRRAGDSRGYGGKWLWHAKVIGQMIGALFVRSYERGERVYSAMLARGFDGKAMPGDGERLMARDWAFAGLALAALAAVRMVTR